MRSSVSLFCSKRRVISLFFVILFSGLVYSETTVKIAPYTKDEFPQWANDLRRTEIITFGSLPFVNLGTLLCYSFYRYYDHGFSSEYIPNPLAKTSDSANLDSSEQMKILTYSLAISLGLGITDFTINFIKRNMKRTQKTNTSIIITPIAKDNPASGELLSDKKSPENRDVNSSQNSEYMIGGMTSAVF